MKFLFLAGLLALVACSPKVAPGTLHNIKPIIAPASIAAPVKDIYTVDEVLMKSRGGDDYEFAAAAVPHYTGAEITYVIYCRVSMEAKKLGYQNWYPQMSYTQLTDLKGPRIAGSIVTFTRGPIPAGASDRESKTQWCKK